MCVGVRFRSESAWVFLIKISELRDSKSEFFFFTINTWSTWKTAVVNYSVSSTWFTDTPGL